jgi:NADH:ubiquinone oxidoreductase subunit 4 (subunit M)
MITHFLWPQLNDLDLEEFGSSRMAQRATPAVKQLIYWALSSVIMLSAVLENCDLTPLDFFNIFRTCYSNDPQTIDVLHRIIGEIEPQTIDNVLQN